MNTESLPEFIAHHTVERLCLPCKLVLPVKDTSSNCGQTALGTGVLDKEVHSKLEEKEDTETSSIQNSSKLNIVDNQTESELSEEKLFMVEMPKPVVQDETDTTKPLPDANGCSTNKSDMNDTNDSEMDHNLNVNCPKKCNGCGAIICDNALDQVCQTCRVTIQEKSRKQKFMSKPYSEDGENIDKCHEVCFSG